MVPPEGGILARYYSNALRRKLDDLILIAGLCAIAFIVTQPDISGIATYLDQLRAATSVLNGHMKTTDITTDFVGFRTLYYGGDPYAILSDLLKQNSIDWDVRHASTHPPTAYLLVGLIALLPTGWAVAIWSWLMIAAIALG
jgi:hypothetical protein